jgi:archaellum component FlaF (FlaF/FlaG flagellin family)
MLKINTVIIYSSKLNENENLINAKKIKNKRILNTINFENK